MINNKHIIALAAGIALVACADEQETPSEPTPSGSASIATAPLLMAAGDIAVCGSGYDEATAKLIAQYPSAAVATLGDNAYADGTASNYSQCYAPSWGTFKFRTHPAPGNHDYHVSGATAYYKYFGSQAGSAGKGYYGYTLGGWRIYSLNSEANVSTETGWLKTDIAAHPTKCILAYWHKALFSSGPHGNISTMKPVFTVLYNVGADIVLSGHDHDYERFAKQTPDGRGSSAGIREFVVGTGGAGLYRFNAPKPNSQVRYNGGHGVLQLTLADAGYSWRFLSVAGKNFTDSGSGACH
jgi:acid phosphatase type 7